MPQEVIEITEREIEIIEVIERGPVGPQGPQPDINYEVVSSARTLEAADLIAADTSGGAFTLTLPLNPSNGDAVDIFDFSETFDTNPLTIARNGQPIESLNEDLVANVEGAYFTLIYTGATRGWQVLPRYGTSGGGGESALTTQGDMLYRGVGINTRLPIGSAGQILKVNSGATAPEWGAAPATGVTSVSGTAPIASSGGATPTISISAATTSAAGSMSSADKTKLDGIAANANNYTHPNHSGDVTSVGDGATAIANDAVTNAKLANVATATIKGRATAGTGDPEDLTATQARTILNVADGAEVNVQSNWTEADSGSDAFILNKPTLGGAAALNVGTTTGTVAAGDDARFTDSRTPTAHAASHASAGSDPLFDQDLNTTDSVTFNDGTFQSFQCDELGVLGEAGIGWGSEDGRLNTRTNLGLGDAATADIGTGSTEVAAGDHGHGNINSSGQLGTTAGLPVVTTTAGAVTTLALGAAGTVLTVNSGATGVEFAAASGGGSKTYAVFSAEHNQPPSTAFATLDTRNSIAVLDFDDATDESAVFVSIIPEGASLGSGLKIRLHWMATTATSGNVVWDVSLERMTTDLDSDSFDTIASGTAAANTTQSGILTVTEITLTTIDSVTAGDGFRLKVTRDANNASDTMTGDAELVAVEVRSAA